MESIAAITFTEKAAAELRDRIRQRFEEAARSARSTTTRSATPSPPTALAELDGAAVGTLHSFAQRILNEHPVEAGLPPGVEVLDEIGSQVEFEAQWHQFLDELLDDAAMGRSILALEAAGVRLDALRQLALQMTDNWDLVAERLDRAASPPPAFDLAGLLARFDEVIALRDHCTDAGRRAPAQVHVPPREQGPPRRRSRRDRPDGDRRRHGREGPERREDRPRQRRQGRQLGDPRGRGEGARSSSSPGTATPPSPWSPGRPRPHRRTARRLRGRHGRRTPGDRAARVPRPAGPRPAAAAFARARCRGAPVAARALRAAAARRVPGHRPDPDRARRPDRRRPDDDIDRPTTGPSSTSSPAGCSSSATRSSRSTGSGGPTSASTSPPATASPADPSLTVNFRTVAPRHRVDQRRLLRAHPARPRQPARLRAAHRPSHRGAAGRARGRAARRRSDRHQAQRRRPARGRDPRHRRHRGRRAPRAGAVAGPRRGNDGPRDRAGAPAEPSDICILLPARTSLPFLERALDRAGVPYRAETSSLVYATREVRELMLALRAVADSDRRAGDGRRAAVVRLRLRRRRPRPLAARPRRPVLAALGDCPTGWQGHPVGDGLAHLARAPRGRGCGRTRPSCSTGWCASGACSRPRCATGAPRDVWRRLRFVIDQARAWTDAGGRDLRAYLEWARLQGADNARVSETVLPETDDDCGADHDRPRRQGPRVPHHRARRA